MPQHEDKARSVEVLREKLARLEREAVALTENRKTIWLELADLQVGRDRFREKLSDVIFEASKPGVDWRMPALELLDWLSDHVEGGYPEKEEG